MGSLLTKSNIEEKKKITKNKQNQKKRLRNKEIIIIHHFEIFNWKYRERYKFFLISVFLVGF